MSQIEDAMDDDAAVDDIVPVPYSSEEVERIAEALVFASAEPVS